MNIEALNEFADYLDRGEFGGKAFHMGCYQDCVLGHYAARELKRLGRPAYDAPTPVELSARAFGIKHCVDIDDWTFAFGAQWGDDYHAAADRLRYLARHGAAPSRDQWDNFRKHPQPVVALPQEAPEPVLAVAN